MAKYGMSMCVLGMSEEFKPLSIAVNALWPRTGELHKLIRICYIKEFAKYAEFMLSETELVF